MDAPAIGRPMGARRATYTLHRVSAQHLLSHRHPESRVCFPLARAREPFYATFSFVSRCHAGGVWVTRRAYVCTRLDLDTRLWYVFVCICVCVFAFLRSHARSFVHPSDGDARAKLDVARRFCFIRESSSSFVRTRASPSSSRSCRPSVAHSLEKERERERGQLERRCPPRGEVHPPATSTPSLLPVLVRRTPDVNAPRTFAHLFAPYRAGLQRNAKESLTSTHP